MILKLFPSSEMGHYYLGKYYESGKDFKGALEQYRLGYGKMDPKDPNADLFYQNVERLLNKERLIFFYSVGIKINFLYLCIVSSNCSFKGFFTHL